MWDMFWLSETVKTTRHDAYLKGLGRRILTQILRCITFVLPAGGPPGGGCGVRNTRRRPKMRPGKYYINTITIALAIRKCAA